MVESVQNHRIKQAKEHGHVRCGCGHVSIFCSFLQLPSVSNDPGLISDDDLYGCLAKVGENGGLGADFSG